MLRIALHLGLAMCLVWLCAASAAQTPPAPVLPTITLALPDNVPSERMQIQYLLIGPFGGYAKYTDPQPGVHSYEIQASKDGKAAIEAMLVAYAPGCKLQTFDLMLFGQTRLERAFVCEALGTVKLSGEIIPAQLVQAGKAQVHVSYTAAWPSRMFAMLDSFTTEFDIGTAPVAPDGTFQMDLPDLYADSAIPSSRDAASFRLTLLGLNSGKVISVNLEPQATDLHMPTGHLPILPSYPGRLLFAATPVQSPGSQTGSSAQMPN